MEMVHNAHVSYYPRAGFFRVGRRMYSARNMTFMGRHFWPFLVDSHSRPGAVVILRDSVCNAFFVALRGPDQRNQFNAVQFYICPTVAGLTPITHVWRIQRAVRGWLRERRALATMMAWHVRLGEASALVTLPCDVMRQHILV